jgi:hypothetical protein
MVSTKLRAIAKQLDELDTQYGDVLDQKLVERVNQAEESLRDVADALEEAKL